MYDTVVCYLGIDIMPWSITKMMLPVLEHLRDCLHSLRLVSYLDNGMRMHHTVFSLLEVDRVVCALLDVSSWYRNSDKSEWSPRQERVFSGINVDALDVHAWVPVEMLRGFLAEVSESSALEKRREITLRLFVIASAVCVVLWRHNVTCVSATWVWFFRQWRVGNLKCKYHTSLELVSPVMEELDVLPQISFVVTVVLFYCVDLSCELSPTLPTVAGVQLFQRRAVIIAVRIQAIAGPYSKKNGTLTNRKRPLRQRAQWSCWMPIRYVTRRY